MGISYQASDIFNKMKLLSAVVALALAEEGADNFPGRVDDGVLSACGSKRLFADKGVVNSTCTISFGGFNPQHVSVPNCMSAGGGAFEGMECDFIAGGGLEVLVFWEQGLNGTGFPDGSTCGNYTDISATCTDNGEQPSGLRIGNAANNYHSGDAEVTHNVDFFGATDAGATVVLNDQDGNAASVTNATCASCGSISFTDNSVTFTSGDGGELFNQISITTTSQISNVKSTIA